MNLSAVDGFPFPNIPKCGIDTEGKIHCSDTCEYSLQSAFAVPFLIRANEIKKFIVQSNHQL
jgi:hypothetical protein